MTPLEVVGLLVVVGLVGAAAWRFLPEKWRALGGVVLMVLTAAAATILTGRRREPQPTPTPPTPSAGKKHLEDAIVADAAEDIALVEDAADTGDYDTLDTLLNADLLRR